jgi:protein gp37
MSYLKDYVSVTDAWVDEREYESPTKWNGKTAFVESALEKPLHWKSPRVIFVCSMSDLFHDSVPFEWVDKVFAIMARCPQHKFLLLTKRPQRMAEYYQHYSRQTRGDIIFAKGFYDNVGIGVTVCKKDELWKLDELRKIQAAMKFVSIEPMLGYIDLNLARPCDRNCQEYQDAVCPGFTFSDCPFQRHLDWVILGGESGHNARPLHPDWVRSIQKQCADASVPFFFKQWGEWMTIYDRDKDDPDCRNMPKTKYGRWLNIEGGHGFHGDRVVYVDPVGRSQSGYKLDGKEYRETPKWFER